MLCFKTERGVALVTAERHCWYVFCCCFTAGQWPKTNSTETTWNVLSPGKTVLHTTLL